MAPRCSAIFTRKNEMIKAEFLGRSAWPVVIKMDLRATKGGQEGQAGEDCGGLEMRQQRCRSGITQLCSTTCFCRELRKYVVTCGNYMQFKCQCP